MRIRTVCVCRSCAAATHFVESSWEEAYQEIERRLRPIIETHGLEAVTAYFGNPVAHNYSLSRYVGAFTPMAGLPIIYSAGTVDQWPKNLSNALVFGAMWTFAIPDIDRCDFLVVMGANPHASQGSLLACPDVLGRLDAIRKRGGKVVVVDPRRTGTAVARGRVAADSSGRGCGSAAGLGAGALRGGARGSARSRGTCERCRGGEGALRGLHAGGGGGAHGPRRRGHPSSGGGSLRARIALPSTGVSEHAIRRSGRWRRGSSMCSTC